MFQTGMAAGRGDDQIDFGLAGKPAYFLERLPPEGVDVFSPQIDGVFLRDILEMPSHPPADFQLRNNQRHRSHGGERVIGLEDMHEVQIGAEAFQQREREFNRFERRRREIDWNQNIAYLHRLANRLVASNAG